MDLHLPAISKMTVANYSNLQSEIRDEILENDFIHDKVKVYFDETYIPASNLFGKVFKKKSKSAYIDVTKSINEKRKLKYNNLRFVVKGNTRKSDEEISNAAKQVNQLIKRYGNFTMKSFNSNTALVNDFLDEFNGEYAKYIDVLGIEKEVLELREANNEFKDIMKLRTKEDTEIPKETVADVRKVLDPAIRTLCGMISSLSVVEKNEEYTKFIARLNAIFKRYGASSMTSSSVSGKGSTDSSSNGSEDGEDGGSQGTSEYPNAKKWEEDLPFQGVENGDIYYIIVDGKNVFYKLVDKQKFFWHPESAKAAGGWEKLS